MRRTSVSPTPASQADAKRYETYLRANWQPGRKSARELRAEADKALAASTDPRAASRAYAQAVVADANDADAWLGLARSLLAIKAEQSSERYDLPVNASGAALIAYERGQNPVFKASALWVLHEALKRRSYWRPAIDALQRQPDAGRHGRGAQGAGGPGRRARLPHPRIQGRRRFADAAPVHPVLRAAGGGRRPTGRSISRSTARTRRR